MGGEERQQTGSSQYLFLSVGMEREALACLVHFNSREMLLIGSWHDILHIAEFGLCISAFPVMSDGECLVVHEPSQRAHVRF